MYIWAAQIQAKPGTGSEAGAKVAELRDILTTVIERPVWAWAAVAGAPVGAFALSTRLDGTVDLVDGQTKLAGNAEYQTLAASTAELWAGPTQTNLNQVVATSGQPGEPKPVTSTTRATLAGGHMGDGLAWSVEVLEHVTKVTGVGGVLTTAAAGNIFEVNWIFGFESAAASDAANDALSSDADYVAMIDRGGEHFVDGSAERFLLVQLP